MLCIIAFQSINLEHNAPLAHHLAQIYQAVAHATERSVYAHSRGIGNFLETKVLVKAHVQYFFLIVGQFFQKPPHIGKRLLGNHFHLHSYVGQRDIVEKIGIARVIGYDIRVAILAIFVNHKVVGYAGKPSRETTAFHVSALSDCNDGSHECFLKQIVCHLVVVYKEENV